ncbi:hypothetical protein [Naasia lichenicola]|nr:hypothetical protein [Naasia lichenicola]
MAGRERNRVVAVIIAVVVVALAVYGPVALLAPLPSTTGKTAQLASESASTTPPVLPAAGSSGVTLSADEVPLAGGSSDALPMAAIAKVITALVVLDQAPLQPGRAGPAIPVTADDYASYAKFQAQGTRAIRVVTGDSWSEREALQAMLIASSNNHAEMVARWAFGSLDNYLTAAQAWLAENGLASVVVVDPTGLSDQSVASGSDLAQISALAMADPFIAETVTTGQVVTTRGGVFDNTISYQAASGVIGISRSYTDEAGVCLLFAVPVTVDASTSAEGDAASQQVTVYGAIVGEPSYDDLDADFTALVASLPGAIGEHVLLAKGAVVGTYSTPWGSTANAVARDGISVLGFSSSPDAAPVVVLDPVATASKGTRVGTFTISGPATTDPESTASGADSGADGGSADTASDQVVTLVLDRAITDPGPLWRLSSPGVVIPAMIGSISGSG